MGVNWGPNVQGSLTNNINMVQNKSKVEGGDPKRKILGGGTSDSQLVDQVGTYWGLWSDSQ